MTESEYKEQTERLEKYNNAKHKISIIEKKKDKICVGIISITCGNGWDIDFDCLGDNFNERLVSNVVLFLDSEIEIIRKSMEDI